MILPNQGSMGYIRVTVDAVQHLATSVISILVGGLPVVSGLCSLSHVS
jgi:hypothetical protein